MKQHMSRGTEMAGGDICDPWGEGLGMLPALQPAELKSSQDAGRGRWRGWKPLWGWL